MPELNDMGETPASVIQREALERDHDSECYKNMVKVSTNKVTEGLMPAEKIALIEIAGGGLEEVSVSDADISDDNKLLASFIGQDKERVLVELPRESASGRWRIWVNASAVA